MRVHKPELTMSRMPEYNNSRQKLFLSIFGVFLVRRVLPYMTPNASTQATWAGMDHANPAGTSISRRTGFVLHDDGTCRRMFTREQLLEILALAEDAVQYLIDTRQLTPLRICGAERFDSLDVYGLIDAYKRTATRQVGMV